MAHKQCDSLTSQPGRGSWWLAMLGCYLSTALLLVGVFNYANGVSPSAILGCGLLTAVFGGAWLPGTPTQKLDWLSLGRWLGSVLILFFISSWMLLAAPVETAVKLTVAVGLLLTLCCAIKLWLVQCGRSNASALLPYLVILTLLSLAPLTFGPTAELMAQQVWFADVVIAISPYSYLASWLNHDYLREPWFYQNTPLGSLQFNYPSATALSAVYLGITALLLAKVSTTTSEAQRVPNVEHIVPEPPNPSASLQISAHN